MPRLRDPRTGSVVNVSDATAARLSGYEPVDPEPTPAPAKRAAKKAPAKKAASRKSAK